MRAFIFSSRGDIESACVVSGHVKRLGHSAVVMIDEEDWDAGERDLARHATADIRTTTFRRSPRLVGSRCVAGIFRAMIAEAGGSMVIAKLDADMVLSWRALDWLAGASETGRMIRLGNGCSGAWAMPTARAGSALSAIDRQRCIGCPEAVLSSRAIRETVGIELSEQAFTVWRLPREAPTNPFAVTLPSGMQSADRLASVLSACAV